MRLPINLCFVFDEKFADFFKVALLSIDSNTLSRLAVYVVDCGISEQKRTELEQFVSTLKNVVLLQFRQPERVDVIEKYNIQAWFSTAIFYRLVVPKIFPELGRVIYLDCDIIADGDIIELWNEDLNGCPFGAVEEDGNFFKNKERENYKARIGVHLSNKYFLSGMLLIDCKKFEESKIFERVIKCIQTSKVAFCCPEQDAMNVCLNNDEHCPLSPKYNFCPFAPLAQKCLKIIQRAVVVHYSGMKPHLCNRKLISVLSKCHMFPYVTNMFLKFWNYADRIDIGCYQHAGYKDTLRFLWKRIFQPIEHFVAKGMRDSVVRFFRKNKLL